MLAVPSRATGQAGHYLRSLSRAWLTRALTLAAGKSRERLLTIKVASQADASESGWWVGGWGVWISIML